MAAIDVTEETFETEVLEKSKTAVVVIDLWAEWCGPCKTLGPILEKVIDETAGSKAVNREVEIGARRPGELEVVAGLAEGEKVVTHGTLTVRPGQQVTSKAVETADQPAPETRKPAEGS